VEKFKIFLLPSEPVYSRIKEVKLELRNLIGNYTYSAYEPHVSLIYLIMDPGHMADLATKAEEFVRTVNSFEITLNKVVAPGRGLIFVDMEKSLPLRELTNSLHKLVKDYLMLHNVAQQDFEKYLKHHITVGNYIKSDKYVEAKSFMEKVPLPGSFEAQTVVVYREDPHSRENVLLKKIDLV